MSRIPRLPEETLHEIISLCMTPSNFFERYGDGIWPDPRNSQFLLVSKQWLRIGTPILYRHLRLTDQEQTKTVGHLVRPNIDSHGTPSEPDSVYSLRVVTVFVSVERVKY